MRIIIDGRMISWTGIGRFSTNLISNLENMDNDNEYIVLLQSHDVPVWIPSSPNFRIVIADYKPYSLKEQILLPILLYKLKPDLVHFLHFNLPLLYMQKFIVTIYDLTLVNFKNLRGNGLKKMLYYVKYWASRIVLSKALRSSKLVITISNFIKLDLINSFGINASKIEVIYGAANNIQASKKTINLPAHFLLYVGNFYPHKNIDKLIDAFAILQKKRPDISLILVGKEDYFQKKLISKVKQLEMRNSVLFTGFIGDLELPSYYKQATILVLPSLSEGFGLTALEAMISGTPVVASKLSAIPEICKTAAAYFDPQNIHNIAETIDKLLSEPKELDRLRNLGYKRAKEFSWERMAKQTLECYRKVAK